MVCLGVVPNPFGGHVAFSSLPFAHARQRPPQRLRLYLKARAPPWRALMRLTASSGGESDSPHRSPGGQPIQAARLSAGRPPQLPCWDRHVARRTAIAGRRRCLPGAVAPPPARPRDERHLSKAQQAVVDTRPEALLQALRACKGSACGCDNPQCHAVDCTEDVLHECNGHRVERSGCELAALLRTARGPNGELTGVVCLRPGLAICGRKWRDAAAIKPNMWRAMVKSALADNEPPSLWNDNEGAGAARAAHKRDTIRSWVRSWADYTGDVVPNAHELHLDALESQTIYKVFLSEMEYDSNAYSYSYFCACLNEECTAEGKPRIVFRKKKAVSSVCRLCLGFYTAVKGLLETGTRAEARS